MVDMITSDGVEDVYQIAFMRSILRGLNSCTKTYSPIHPRGKIARRLACRKSRLDGACADAMGGDERDEQLLHGAVAIKLGQNPPKTECETFTIKAGSRGFAFVRRRRSPDRTRGRVGGALRS
jgi:hypothetical protein